MNLEEGREYKKNFNKNVEDFIVVKRALRGFNKKKAQRERVFPVCNIYLLSLFTFACIM